MKITTFDPIIVSPKADDVIKVFEELGFEKTHCEA
jgi:predicted RNA binding protein YcfA (HicA-like mRNA interferase family)